jgi:hypothetical protein
VPKIIPKEINNVLLTNHKAEITRNFIQDGCLRWRRRRRITSAWWNTKIYNAAVVNPHGACL